MNNSRVRFTRRKRVRSTWDVYDELPLPIRAALQEGPSQWDVSVLAHRYKAMRRRFSDGEAVRWIMFMISAWNDSDIRDARDWQPPNWGKRKPLPSPHILAQATMQTSGRQMMGAGEDQS